jgi:hypothetical protein
MHRRFLAVTFLIVIAAPVAANLAGADGADPVAENREMAAFPTFDGSWRSAAGYPGAFSAWFDDHFGFRATLIRWNARVSVEALRTSSTPSVLLGKNGWLFYADDGADEDVANERALTIPEVENWRTTVLRTRDWLHSRGIAYVFTIPPDKHVIYPDQMPDGVRRIGSSSRAEQVFSSFEGEDFVVNPRSALEHAATRERIYHRTDTHWNERGAFVAYQTIVDALRRQAPEVPPPWPRSDFDDTATAAMAGDLAAMLGLKRVLVEEALTLTPAGRTRLARVVEPAGGRPDDDVGRLVTEIPGSTLPRAVIFRDSYMAAVVPFLSEHFSRVVYLWQNDFDANVVAEERPDAVVQEIVGRHLYMFVPSPDLVPR